MNLQIIHDQCLVHSDPEGKIRDGSQAYGRIWYQVKAGEPKDVKDIVDANREVLDKPGPVGERPLHMAFLYQRPDMAKALIDDHVEKKESLATTYKLHDDPKQDTSPYRGENALHIAVVWVSGAEEEAANEGQAGGSSTPFGSKRDEAMEIVSYLLEKAMEQNTLAELLLSPVTGGFFSNGAPSVHMLRTSETPSVYFGETPLDFAVANDQIALVQKLLEAAKQLCSRGLPGYRAIRDTQSGRAEIKNKLRQCFPNPDNRDIDLDDHQLSRQVLIERLLRAACKCSPRRPPFACRCSSSGSSGPHRRSSCSRAARPTQTICSTCA